MLFLLLLCVSVAVSASVSDALQPLSDELIRYVNEKSGAHWRAEKSSRFRTMKDIRSLLGTNFEPAHLKRSRRPTVHHHIEAELPKSFDAREHWPNCTTIGKIRDQSGCGSCWAFGATEAMSDRICIASRGKVHVELSSRHLLSCCHKCGFGCEGGMLGPAWDYWTRSGLVTGSSMEESEGCQPYPFPMCTHHGSGTYPPCPEYTYPTPGCKHTCQKQYNKTYSNDKHYGRSSYNIPCDEKQIMKEIMTHGPVEAAFTVYDDFMNYKSGVYHHVTGGLLGGHAIKILGWGVEGKTPYWLVANSWNEEWGENGFFRIRRGNNECGIEDEVIAGLAKH